MTISFSSRPQGNRRVTPIALASLATLMGAVVASYAMGQGMAMDSDGDGLVSYTELLVILPEVTGEEFAAMDVDGSGALDESELAAAQDSGMLPAT